MDACTLVATLLGVGERYAVSTDDMRPLVGKVVALSLRYLPRRELWAGLFGDDFVDWNLVEASSQNILGDTEVWLALLALCTWEDGFPKLEGEISASHPPLHTMRTCMQGAGLDTGTGWTMACKAHILSLVKGLPSLHTLELLTGAEFKRNTRPACLDLLSRLADVTFTPEEQLKTMGFVLRHMQVDCNRLNQNRLLYAARKEEKTLCLKLKSVVAVQGRPRLRDRLASTLKTDDHKTQVDISLSTWESYTGFCYLHGFPPTLSEAVKTRLYFLAAQTSWDWRRHLPRILASGGAILARVASHPVSQPDLSIINRVVLGLSMDGAPPFPEMTEFRRRCFGSFPVTHTQRMTLTQILQLYVAGYQAPPIWKEVWKRVVGVISVQIIRDVEAFVRESPFAEDAVVRLLAR